MAATQVSLNYQFFDSAINNDFNEIKRLLTNSKLKPDIHFYNDGCLTLACEKGELDIVKFLLTSSELEDHAYLHADNYQPFKAACFYGHYHILEYLIFDYNMKMDEQIKDYLEKSNSEISSTVKSMFEKREISKKLHSELDKELNLSQSNKKTLKV